MEEHLEGCYKDWQVPHKISSLKKMSLLQGKKKSLKEEIFSGIYYCTEVLRFWVLKEEWHWARFAALSAAASSWPPFIAKDAVNPTEAEQKVEALSPHALLSDCRQTASTLAHDMLASPALEDI